MYPRMLFLAVLVSLACTDTSVPPVAPSIPRLAPGANKVLSAPPPLVVHLVPPKATDPAIDQFLDNHYVWLDTSAHSLHRLLVMMAGSGQRPEQFQLVQREAARFGYHVIGLMFPNNGGLAKICPPTPDPAKCFEDTRLEILDGIDRSPLVTVSPANSIDNRLDKLLRFLVANYPDEGWSQFINHGGPKWPLIAVAGLSVGGGEAAMIAKIRLVDRVLLFSAVPDSIGKASPPWTATHVTPTNRYWGLAHNRDQSFLPITAAWDSIGLAAFGTAVVVDGSSPPYEYSHMLVTGLTPQGGFVGLNAHGSTATDSFTPLAADGTPLLLDAWRYMLSELPRHAGNPH